MVTKRSHPKTAFFNAVSCRFRLVRSTFQQCGANKRTDIAEADPTARANGVTYVSPRRKRIARAIRSVRRNAFLHLLRQWPSL